MVEQTVGSMDGHWQILAEVKHKSSRFI